MDHPVDHQGTAVHQPVTDQSQNWFGGARFGMFVHWGLYSQIAGEWQGKRYYGSAEWIMHQAKIPVSQYEKVADEFNPTQFSATSWIRLAKAAGVKYIVVTAKHHEGFAMFASEVSKFNIVDATPYRRDPLQELCNAARAEGIKIGLYYSQVLDWHERDAEGNDWDFVPKDRQFKSYLETKAIAQISELLTGYGKIDVVWFDMPGDSPAADSQKLYDTVKLHQPDCLVSSRIGNGLGDFTTFGDSEIPARAQAGRNWEAIFTHNDSWGYLKFDNNFKSKSEILRFIIECASRGGNFMLNVGPKGDGSFPEESADVFVQVGEWLNRFGESIYETEGVDLCSVPWGFATKRRGRLYLQILNPPADGKLLVPGFAGDIDRVCHLGGKVVEWHTDAGDLVVQIDRPANVREPFVIEIHTPDGTVERQGYCATISNQYPKMEIGSAQAACFGSAVLKTISYQKYWGDWKHLSAIEGLVDEQSYVTWDLRFVEPGAYRIALEYAADETSEGVEGYVSIAGNRYLFQTVCTGEISSERPIATIVHDIAYVEIESDSVHKLKIGRIGRGSGLFHLKALILTPYV